MSREHPIREGSPFDLLRDYWGFDRLTDLDPLNLHGLKRKKKNCSLS